MKTVLVVEDDAHIRRVLRTLLENEGYAVAEAADGVEGLARALETPPACLLTDTMMPRMDGLTLLQHLRARNLAVPAFIVSAASSLPPAEELRDLGVLRVFAKPFDFDALLAAVRQTCGAP